jgi:hypothetical protein
LSNLKFNIMKKSMLFWSFVMLAVFPAYLGAQESEYPLTVPKFGEVTVSKALPAKVREAVLNDFGESHKPLAWFTNSTLFNDYEWRQSTNVDKLEVYKYAIHVTTNAGSSLDAEYAADGKRIFSREYLKNFRPAPQIMLTLQKNGYKDWGLKETSQLIKASSNGPEKERYALVMTKGKEKKTVIFDGNSQLLAVQKGEHLELADLDR